MKRVASAAAPSVAVQAHIVTAARLWLKPMLMNRWWRCERSAVEIDWWYFSRFSTTNDVSMIGTASTSNGRNRTTVDAVFNKPATEIDASVNPSTSAPESPMKIRAGKKLWRRKPTHAPSDDRRQDGGIDLAE